MKEILDKRFQKPKRKKKRKKQKEKPEQTTDDVQSGGEVQPQTEIEAEAPTPEGDGVPTENVGIKGEKVSEERPEEQTEEKVINEKKKEELTKEDNILGMKIRNKQGIELEVIDVPESAKGNITLKNKKRQKSFISLKNFKKNIEKGIFKPIE